VDTALLFVEQFTDTVTDVLRQPDVRQRMASVLAQQAIEQSDLQSRVEQRLPEDTTFLAPIVAAQLQPLLAQVTERLLETDLAGNLVEGVVRNLQAQVVAVLEDRSAVEITGRRHRTEPPGHRSRLFERIGIEPPQRVQRSWAKTARWCWSTTPPVCGRFRSWSQSHVVSSAFLFLGFAAFAGAVVAAPESRRGLRLVGYSVLAVGLVTLLVLLISNEVLKSVAEQQLVVRELVSALEDNLRWQCAGLLVLGASLVVLADEGILAGMDRLSARGEEALRRFGAGRAILIAAAVLAVVLFLV
jgi:hypothetical protein